MGLYGIVGDVPVVASCGYLIVLKATTRSLKAPEYNLHELWPMVMVRIVLKVQLKYLDATL